MIYTIGFIASCRWTFQAAEEVGTFSHWFSYRVLYEVMTIKIFQKSTTTNNMSIWLIILKNIFLVHNKKKNVVNVTRMDLSETFWSASTLCVHFLRWILYFVQSHSELWHVIAAVLCLWMFQILVRAMLRKRSFSNPFECPSRREERSMSAPGSLLM